MRHLIVIILLVTFSLLTVGFGPPTLIESEAAVTPVSSSTVKQIRADRLPKVGARAWLLMDETTGQVLASKNPHDHRPMASTTKMMTSLVTLEKARLTDVVTAGKNVKVDPTIIGLDPGDTLTVEQMLYGLMLVSGNDAAVALAEHVGGSIPGFADMMNAKATQLGLKDTHFVNPHGFDDPKHYSSAYDLAVLARTALQNPVFARIVSTKEYRIDAPIRWVFKNSNQLLNTLPGADGVKTGYTDEAGRCLVSSATRRGHRAIAVVLDGPDMYEDSGALLDYLLTNYDWESLEAADHPIAESGQGSEVQQVVARDKPAIVFPSWQRPYLRHYYDVSSTPSKGDGAAGAASYYLFGKKVAEVGLYQGN